MDQARPQPHQPHVAVGADEIAMKNGNEIVEAEKQVERGGHREAKRKLAKAEPSVGETGEVPVPATRSSGNPAASGRGKRKATGKQVPTPKAVPRLEAENLSSVRQKGESAVKLVEPAGQGEHHDVPGYILRAQEAARSAHLRYVSDHDPGITRHRDGEHFAFTYPNGKPVTDETEIARIRKLAIPPAYTDVWICPQANGHIQATGRDARGRKQYRYHPRWREVRDEDKYGKMLVFGRVLPKIRARVEHDLKLPGLPREKVLATIVRLMETTLIRVGNTEYARENQSFGLTTLRDQHVKKARSGLVLDFFAKHHIHRRVEIHEKRLMKIIEKCRDIPGFELFQYVDEHGHHHPVDSSDVNHYLHDITGEEITAKDFRTWAATTLAAIALQEFEAFDNAAHAKKNVLRAIEKVSGELGNTPAICRKCYIHPAVFDAYLDGSLLQGLKDRVDEQLRDVHGLTGEEAAVLAFLHERLAHPPVVTTQPPTAPKRKKAA